MQHQPYIKSADNSILFTASDQKAWEFLKTRTSFKDDEFQEDFLNNVVKGISQRINAFIRQRAREDSKSSLDTQDFFQRLIWAAFRQSQYGDEADLPKGFLSYEEFISGSSAVDSAVGAVCCPYLSSLGAFN